MIVLFFIRYKHFIVYKLHNNYFIPVVPFFQLAFYYSYNMF